MKSKQFITASVMLLLIITIMLTQILFEKLKTPPETESVDAWADYMNKRIPELMTAQDIPGLIIALVKDQETIWTEAFGFADLENRILMTEDTKCRLESISKSVTAWGVMKLAEEGSISLDKPLESYLKTWSLPDSAFSEEDVTIKQLLNQTSGMPLGTIGVRYNPNGPLPPLKEFLKTETVLYQEPGTSFSYSNAGYNLLELLIEEVTGRDFAEYMANEVLKPLGMKDSGFIWKDNWHPRVPNGYDIKGRPIPAYVYPDKASGGLFSTAEDTAAFVAAGMRGAAASRGKVLDEKSIQKMYNLSTELDGYYSLIFDGYGFGHFVEILPGGLRAISHGGQGSGWMTQFYSIPDTGDGIVIISNSQRSWPLFSEILIEWCRWNGQPEVGMGIIKRSARILRISIVFGFATVFYGAVRTFFAIKRGRRQFITMNRAFRICQLLQIVLSVVLFSSVICVNRMKYFFLDSVFPAETPALKGLISVFAGFILLTAIFSAKGRHPGHQIILPRKVFGSDKN